MNQGLILTKLAELAQKLDDLNESSSSVKIDRMLQALAYGDDAAGVGNDEEMKQLMQIDNPNMKDPSKNEQAPAPKPERSVLKVISNGITVYPKTVNELKKAMQQYALNAYDVIRSIYRSINLSQEEKAQPVTLDYAINLAVEHGLLQKSWF